jgi:hypothetical protein
MLNINDYGLKSLQQLVCGSVQHTRQVKTNEQIFHCCKNNKYAGQCNNKDVFRQ